MTVRSLQPSTSKAVQTVIVPTQWFVTQFYQFYERPPWKRATKTTRKNHGSRNGTTTAEARCSINDAPRGVRQQTPGSKVQVRTHNTRVNRGAVHAAVGTAMAELGDAPENSCRDNVDGPGNGRNREISACAIRDRAPHQQCASSNPWKPVPRVGPIPVITPSGSNLVASMEPEDLDTPPFTAQERLIYVTAEILNIRFGALLDSGCSDNFISLTTADQLELTRHPLKTAI